MLSLKNSARSISRTTLNELLPYIRTVQEQARLYAGSHSLETSFNTASHTMSYIRSFNGTYTSFLFSMVCGPVDINLATTIDANFPNVKSYFSRFVDSSNYNVGLHGPFPLSGPEREMDYFADPVVGSNNIDLLHMIASLQGHAKTLYSTTMDDAQQFIVQSDDEAEGYYNAEETRASMVSSLVSDLVSWGGDLQSAVKAIRDSEISLDSLTDFEDIMNGPFGCSQPDMLADIDAANIAVTKMGIVGSVADAIESYYDDLNSMQERRDVFVNSVLEFKNSNWSGSEEAQFRSEVGDILGLRYVNGSYETSSEYSNNTGPFYKFAIMGGSASFELRSKVADAFSDWVFGLC